MREKPYLTYSGQLKANGHYWRSADWQVSMVARSLSLSEHGALRNLLDWYVMHGPLTNEDHALRNYSGDPGAWGRVRDVVLGLFEPVEGRLVPSFEVSRHFGRSLSASRQAIPASVRKAVFDRDGYLCAICRSGEKLSLDHIVPYSKGGPDTEQNLRVLCMPCNIRRGNRQ